MHTAPPVRVSVGRSPLWLAAVGGIAAVATFNVTAWALAWQDAPPLGALSGMSALAAALVAGWAGWRRQPSGELAWDGAAWAWQGRAGRLSVALDLDAWMLLRFDGEGARRWLALERRRVTGPWAALRAALYAVPPPAEPDAAPPA